MRLTGLVDALADTEAPHLAIMDFIAGPPPDERPGWLASQAQAAVDIERDLVLGVLNTLTQHGLAETDNDTYSAAPQFMLTKFGNTFLRLIKPDTTELGVS